jgi:hypothetical protein
VINLKSKKNLFSKGKRRNETKIKKKKESPKKNKYTAEEG